MIIGPFKPNILTQFNLLRMVSTLEMDKLGFNIDLDDYLNKK